MKKSTLIKTLAAITMTGLATGALAAANTFQVTLEATPAAQALMGANTKVLMTCGGQTSTISLGSVIGATTNYFSGSAAKCSIKLNNSYGIFNVLPNEPTSAAFNIAATKVSIPKGKETTDVTYGSPIIVRDVAQAATVSMTLKSAADADKVGGHQLVISLDAKNAS